MDSRWSDKEAKALVAGYAKQGVAEDLALRVYTSRLLGRDPALVLHGGGNTSVKTVMADLLGEQVKVLCVKGSGWDMADIEPRGLPAVRLEPLGRLRGLETLRDEDMVNFQRVNLLDSTSPNPSVETLLHAFLPHTFVDHTHATAVLSISDQPDGEDLCRELYGDRMGFVPYIMPGFALAKKAAEIYDSGPGVQGLILHKHGIFTFGESAREAYERMIEMVGAAEDFISSRAKGRVFAAAALPDKLAALADIAPIVRGACALPGDVARPMVLDFRGSEEILAYVNGAELSRYGQAGVVTPDHIIRTKLKPLITPAPEAGGLEDYAGAVTGAVEAYVSEYKAYFERNNARQETPKAELDALPRVVLVPGLGFFGLGESAKAAAVAADIYENTVRTVSDAEALGRFESLDEAALFDMEYWSLEQAKLGATARKACAGQVAAVTGGAGAIGFATAAALAAQGAEIAILDVDAEAAAEAAGRIGGSALGLGCDVTDAAAVRAAFDRVCEVFGGVDIVVSNAGTAPQGRIGEVDDGVLRDSFEINFFGHQTVAREGVRIMRAQGTGGVLLFNVSKQAVNPGADFGPYGLPKAATMLLVRQYALDYGSDGIRANGVNADKIRSGLMTGGMIADRAKARGVSEADYMTGNLLGREVTAEDVAQAFVYLVAAQKTTGHIVTVDGGNIAAALR